MRKVTVMRKVLITLLLASAAASPALAARPDNSDREDRRAERQESRAERQSTREDRAERASDSDRAQYSRPERAERQVEVRQSADRPVHVQQIDRRVVRDVEALRSRDNRVQSQEALRLQRRDNREDRVEAFRERRDDRAQALRERREMRTSRPVVSTTPRFGTQPPLRVERNHSPVNWSSNWRHDHRYDWRSHRDRHRSLFHLGFYFDPFGWGYQRYSIGWRLWPSYYSSSFWLNDPWMYRLPYAPPGTRWIRYYDDAILVDMWSGQVVDVIYDFFW
jgi:hypothetical protein